MLSRIYLVEMQSFKNSVDILRQNMAATWYDPICAPPTLFKEISISQWQVGFVPIQKSGTVRCTSTLRVVSTSPLRAGDAFFDRGARRWWVVSFTSRPFYTAVPKNRRLCETNKATIQHITARGFLKLWYEIWLPFAVHNVTARTVSAQNVWNCILLTPGFKRHLMEKKPCMGSFSSQRWNDIFNCLYRPRRHATAWNSQVFCLEFPSILQSVTQKFLQTCTPKCLSRVVVDRAQAYYQYIVRYHQLHSMHCSCIQLVTYVFPACFGLQRTSSGKSRWNYKIKSTHNNYYDIQHMLLWWLSSSCAFTIIQ
jgi:hypothetical protein